MHTIDGTPLHDTELRRVDASWRAANYLSVGQIYPRDNPLLREPLLPAQVKPDCSGTGGPLGFGEKAVVMALRVPDGDFRDWKEIDSWATQIAAELSRATTR